MFLHPDHFPFHQLLEAHWREIRDEAQALNVDDFVGWDQYTGFTGTWSVVPLFTAIQDDPCKAVTDLIPYFQERCPRTWGLLQQIPGLMDAVFSRLGPHTHIVAHQDDERFENAWRGHLGLVTPAGARFRVLDEVQTWEEGKCFFFNGRQDHEAINESDSERIVLLFDVYRDAYPIEARAAG